MTNTDCIKWNQLAHAYINPRCLATQMTKFCMVTPNTFSIMTEFFFLHRKMFITSHTPSIKCMITVTIKGHSRIMGPQYQPSTCHPPSTWNLEVAPRLLGIVVDPWSPMVLHGWKMWSLTLRCTGCGRMDSHISQGHW